VLARQPLQTGFINALASADGVAKTVLLDQSHDQRASTPSPQ
jgi:hypothetical protein